MCVYVADGGVEGAVAFHTRDGVAFEAGDVEEGVDYFVFCSLLALALSRIQGQEDVDEQFPRKAAS